MIRREADGYYVELRPTRFGQPSGRAIRWGPYATRALALAVEQRNRAQLARESAPPRPPTVRGAHPACWRDDEPREGQTRGGERRMRGCTGSGLLHMRPALTTHDQRDRHLADAKCPRDGDLGIPGGMSVADGAHVRCPQHGLAVDFAVSKPVPPLRVPVGCIIRSGPEKQMGRAATAGVITAMADHMVDGDWPMPQHPRDAMGVPLHTMQLDNAISSVAAGPLPFPAFFVLAGSCPEMTLFGVSQTRHAHNCPCVCSLRTVIACKHTSTPGEGI
jgi:hypothetical protein